jgi:thymidylate kinase
VIERGWWDLAVDPLRYRLRPHPRLIRALGRLLPQPDVLFVLEAPADVLMRRKREVSAEELARQMQAWREILPDRVRRVYLDVSAPVDHVVAEAATALGLTPLRIRFSM